MSNGIPKERRSWNMSRIRSENTSIETMVRKYLFREGFRYRKNARDLPGKPDIVLPKYKTVIFVNGCFWHKHDCPRFVWPSTNQEYWIPKIERNVARDIENQKLLKDQGWQVLVVWECQLKKAFLESTMEQLAKEIRRGLQYNE